jgi:hypothetical protein
MTTTTSDAKTGDSLMFPLRNGNKNDPGGLGRIPAWADEDGARRRLWLSSMVRAAAGAGFGEIIWHQPWGVKPGQPGVQGWVPEGQCAMLRERDWERFTDLMYATVLARDLGIERRTAFEGFGRVASFWRRIFGQRWMWPEYTNEMDRKRFAKHIDAAVQMGCTGLALDSFAAGHMAKGQGANWRRLAADHWLELISEGYAPEFRECSWMLWGDQIDRTADLPEGLLLPAATKGGEFRRICVINGHTLIERNGARKCVTPADMLEAAERFRAEGWSICFEAAGVGEIRALGTRH